MDGGGQRRVANRAGPSYNVRLFVHGHGACAASLCVRQFNNARVQLKCTHTRIFNGVNLNR